MGATRPHTAAVTVGVAVLLLAGCLEAAASVLTLASGGTHTVPALGGPEALLPITLAVLLALLGGRVARIAALFGAVPALVVRLVFASSLLVPGTSFTIPEILTVSAGAVTGLAVAGFALYLVVRHHDLAEVPVSDPAARLAAPAPQVAPTGGLRRLPESPSTPVSLDLRTRTANGPGSWATASTPWPRAVEEDPNGTLIRPPRR